MYQTSDNYKQKIYEASTQHLLKVYINNKEVEEKYILGFKPSQPLFSNNEFTLGSATSQAVELKLYKSAVPNKINSIYIESGILGEPVPIRIF